MSHDWYGKQFGDRDQFALCISFGRDPHPTGDRTIDAIWGGLSIWAKGRCLTRSVSDEGGACDEVRWSLGSILEWLMDVGVRLVNEEPFPDALRKLNVRDACDWFNKAETPPPMTEAEEDAWFSRRSDWRRHHAIRGASLDVALPNVMIRRLGDFLEISWDNETWGAPRPDLSFVERRGTVLVAASRAACDLREALIEASQALVERHELPELAKLASRAKAASAGDDDWRWLIHAETARAIQDELAPIRERLDLHVRTQRIGLYVPHAPETLLLRHAGPVPADEVQTLLDTALSVPAEPMKDPLWKLVRPTPAPAVMPWKEGYERAREVRDALGWGDEPVPNIDEWLESNNVGMTRRVLSSTIDLVATRTADKRGSAVINPSARLRWRREISSAAALGHLLFDVAPIAVDGAWEHWPTAARARAFAAMLLLPDGGVREVLAGRANIDASDVSRVMNRFNTGPHATTYHLKNLEFIDEERRMEILRELSA